jgi:hypothetical protein
MLVHFQVANVGEHFLDKVERGDNASLVNVAVEDKGEQIESQPDCAQSWVPENK